MICAAAVTRRMRKCNRHLYRRKRKNRQFCAEALKKMKGKIKCCETRTVMEPLTPPTTTTTSTTTPAPILVRKKVCKRCRGKMDNSFCCCCCCCCCAFALRTSMLQIWIRLFERKEQPLIFTVCFTCLSLCVSFSLSCHYLFRLQRLFNKSLSDLA